MIIPILDRVARQLYLIKFCIVEPFEEPQWKSVAPVDLEFAPFELSTNKRANLFTFLQRTPKENILSRE